MIGGARYLSGAAEGFPLKENETSKETLRDSRKRTLHSLSLASDLNGARDFYENVLGILPKSELPSGAFYDCGQRTRFVLSKER